MVVLEITMIVTKSELLYISGLGKTIGMKVRMINWCECDNDEDEISYEISMPYMLFNAILAEEKMKVY